MQEFKRCKRIRYDFITENQNPLTVIDRYKLKYKGIDFFYIDTLSELGITYDYKIRVELDDFKIVNIWFDDETELSDSCSMAKVIRDLEGDSILSALIRNADVSNGHYEWPYFVYTGPHDIIKYSDVFGVMYFKVDKPTAQLHLSPYSQIFQKRVKEKGFDFGDFDSLRFAKYSEGISNSKTIITVWRLQGFISAFKSDFIEVGTWGQERLDLHFLSIPDTLSPDFLDAQVLDQLMKSGLSDTYIKRKLILCDKGATRAANYYKKENRIIDSTRVTGYFKYQWLTESWLDRLHGGFKIIVYFTYFMNRPSIEWVRIGTYTWNFHEKIVLHPIARIITLDAIKQIAPGVDTSKIGFKITQEGRVLLTFPYEKDDYEVDAETGNFTKQRHVTLMCDIFPFAQHLYWNMEWTVNTRRKK